jgi:hypothetical protein
MDESQGPPFDGIVGNVSTAEIAFFYQTKNIHGSFVQSRPTPSSQIVSFFFFFFFFFLGFFSLFLCLGPALPKTLVSGLHATSHTTFFERNPQFG